MAEQKTSIKQMPLCNDKVKAETAKLCKVPEGKVEEVMTFLGNYIADVIRSGTMEGVMIPYFGKFRAKNKIVQKIAHDKKQRKNGSMIIHRALEGKSTLIPKSDFKPKQDNDENS